MSRGEAKLRSRLLELSCPPVRKPCVLSKLLPFGFIAKMAEPQHIATGKVRDIYSTSDPNALLFVASDRVSAFDVIMKNVGGRYCFARSIISDNALIGRP
jgi:hypothetical protein